MIFDKRMLSLLIIAPLGVEAASHGGGGDIGRFLKDHQATFTRMRQANLLNKVPSSPEDLRNLAADGSLLGGCTRVKDGSKTQTVCIGEGGEIASCLVEAKEGFCEHSIIDFNTILNSDNVGGGLMDFLENGRNPFLCQSCTNNGNEIDCTNLASTFDVNACTAEADFYVECDENTECCNLEAAFEGEQIKLNCCIESDANTLDSRCCASYNGEELCSGLEVSCPEGMTADSVMEQCTCAVTFNGETCQGCNFCPSKPDALGVVADGGFEYTCDNIVPAWSQNCDEAPSIGIGDPETSFTGTEMFRAISVFPPDNASTPNMQRTAGDNTSSSWHVPPTHPLTIFLAATAAGLFALV
eukprot:CAMPEP_0198280062 /NCGR_PEP_ID=MMETSP1449-20131203/226_1 /TAXON_ID=420275 /ORGANISM="Attheya septentrionalis, Strain CCMP2084" /LENGTH=355 /DNA_ID=CAMNT_0043975327 /DNA_START=30 /DNA_END=1097 /DNA_ORIENTATION=+